MSLLDALLLEPAPLKTPTAQTIFIALRTDGAVGSGTASDPYDGGTRLGSPLSADLTFNPRDVIAVTSDHSAHGFSDNDSITISHVSGDSAGAYNGLHAGLGVVVRIHEYAFRFRLEAVPVAPPGPRQLVTEVDALDHDIHATDGSIDKKVRLYWPVVRVGTASNHGFPRYAAMRISGASEPLLNGDFVAIAMGANYCWCLLTGTPAATSETNRTCAQLVYRFDDVMRAAPVNSRIELGPGVFGTRGLDQLHYVDSPGDVSVGFRVKSGQKLKGSGMGVTQIKLFHAIDPLDLTIAVRGSSLFPASYFEASDFSIDCNLGGQPVPGGIGLAPVTCSAMAAWGDHIRFSRIRTINWGCQCPVEAFVLTATGSDCVIQDCIAERPAENNTHESTLFTCGEAGTRGAVMRDNYVNCAYANGDYPVRVSSISRFSDKVALLTAAEPHRHVKSKNIVVSGALVGGSLNNSYNGIFAILEIVSETQLKYQMYENPTNNANADVSTGVIGLETSSEYVAVEAIVSLGSDLYKVITRRPHHVTAGQFVAPHGLAPDHTPFSGHSTYHQVLSVEHNTDNRFTLGSALRPNAFRIKVLGVEDPPDVDDVLEFDYTYANIGADMHGPAAVGGTGCVTERNRIHDCNNTFYSDTGSTMDSIVRNNSWTNVLKGVAHALGGVDDLPIGGIITNEGVGGLVARFTVTVPPGLLPGHAVDVDLVLVNGSLTNPFNGTFTVRTVSPTRDSFTYDLGEPPQGIIGGTPQYVRRSQTRRFAIERNRLELRPSDANSFSSPGGISLNGHGYQFVLAHPAYIFPQVLIRENIIGYFANGTDTKYSGGNTPGAQLARATDIVMEGNILDLMHQSQGTDYRLNALESNKVRSFNNRDSAGNLIRSFNRDTGRHDDSLEDAIQSALLAGI